ncbi:uncharacterized protein METZ01_LOCUS338302 [marine metagenome]|uniref:Uncharacterized protein n=1 Tax=marine metagenome TaxID=408172 RepID=A0A382QKH8_9ZZZZ
MHLNIIILIRFHGCQNHCRNIIPFVFDGEGGNVSRNTPIDKPNIL